MFSGQKLVIFSILFASISGFAGEKSQTKAQSKAQRKPASISQLGSPSLRTLVPYSALPQSSGRQPASGPRLFQIDTPAPFTLFDKKVGGENDNTYINLMEYDLRGRPLKK